MSRQRGGGHREAGKTVLTVRLTADGEQPPAGSPVVVEAQDTSVADAASRVVASSSGVTGRSGEPWLAELDMTIGEREANATIWAHVDVDADGRVSIGDFITMESYPAAAAVGGVLDVRVRAVRS